MRTVDNLHGMSKSFLLEKIEKYLSECRLPNVFPTCLALSQPCMGIIVIFRVHLHIQIPQFLTITSFEQVHFTTFDVFKNDGRLAKCVVPDRRQWQICIYTIRSVFSNTYGKYVCKTL